MDGIGRQPDSAFQIPIIDVGGLRSGDQAQIAAVVAQFRRICPDTGFFYAANHGVPESTIAGIFAAAARFFEQPVAAKERITMRQNRGYDGFGKQVLDHSIGGDFKESALFGVELAPDHPLVLAGKPNYAVNPWPDGLPGFRAPVSAYFAALHRLSRQLLNGLALSLDLPWDYFEAGLVEPMSSVRLLHYPSHPGADPAREMGAAAHTDWELISILAQDQTGGLEIQLPSGEWIAASPVSGTFVVNLGDMMARWTNDHYASTLHRVMNKSDRDRYSVVFFCDPAYDTPVECLPSCTSAERPPRYEPTVVGEHLAEMWRKSYPSATADASL
jgi:isopenicillin N synthase-like dioxygenase